MLNDLKEARERLNQNSRNSSRPPSSEEPWEERKSGADQQTRLELEDVFVSLKTHVADNNDLDKKSRRLEQSEQQSILLSEAVGKYRRAAVIGKPGSGKTTFVNRLMISLLDRKPLPGWPDEAADLVPLQRESLAEIQKVPLQLTVMALVHTERETLPDKLAVLYKRAVNILIDHWDTLSEADKDHRLQRLLRQANCEREDLLAKLAEVAWNAYGGDLSSRLPANIPLSQLTEAISSIGPADADSYAVWEKNVVHGMRLRAGLLLPVGGKADFPQFPPVTVA